jgi:lipid A 3-O-deacylase
MKVWLTRLFCLGGILSLAAPTLAQTPGVPASSPGPPSTVDTANIVTFQIENDAVSTLQQPSDRYYTSGLRLGWTSGEDQVPYFLQGIGHTLWGEGAQRVSIDISQQLYTPSDTKINPPDPHDRPNAGYLASTFALIQDQPDWRSLLALSVGVIGPAALGEEVQNGFHTVIGSGANNGWHFQLPNEPAFEIYSQRTWRLPIATIGSLETDVLPELTLGLGIVRDYAQSGVIFRIGQGLDSDYGAARILPGVSGQDAYRGTRPFAWYVFAGGDAQAVAHDEFLDGSTLGGPSAHVSKYWDVGELEAGAGIIWLGMRVTYTQTWQTNEFHGQKAGLFSFGSVAISTRF